VTVWSLSPWVSSDGTGRLLSPDFWKFSLVTSFTGGCLISHSFYKHLRVHVQDYWWEHWLVLKRMTMICAIMAFIHPVWRGRRGEGIFSERSHYFTALCVKCLLLYSLSHHYHFLSRPLDNVSGTCYVLESAQQNLIQLRNWTRLAGSEHNSWGHTHPCLPCTSVSIEQEQRSTFQDTQYAWVPSIAT